MEYKKKYLLAWIGFSFLPWIVSPFNSVRGNYSIYEVKNCHNAETIWKFPQFPLSKKNNVCFIKICSNLRSILLLRFFMKQILVSAETIRGNTVIKNWLEYVFPNVQCNQAWRSPAAFSKILSITMRVFIIDKDLNICWLFASIIACYFIQPCSETWQDCLDHFLFGFQMTSK